MHDYKAENEKEISFRRGQRICVQRRVQPNGWWFGFVAGAGEPTSGFFPSTFVHDKVQQNEPQIEAEIEPENEEEIEAEIEEDEYDEDTTVLLEQDENEPEKESENELVDMAEVDSLTRDLRAMAHSFSPKNKVRSQYAQLAALRKPTLEYAKAREFVTALYDYEVCNMD